MWYPIIGQQHGTKTYKNLVAWSNNKERKPLILEGARQVGKTQKTLLTSYLADMAKHSGKENSMHLERLWRNIPNQLAKEQGTTKFQFKNVISGVRNYDRLASTIDWLHKAGLILRVPIVNKAALPLAAYSKENTFKLYVFDVGLLGALSNLSIESILNYRYGSYKGYVVENFAAQELTAQNIDLFSWKENRSEIEFLLQAGEDLVPIEIKAGHNLKARSLTVYHKKYLPKNSFLFSGNWQKKSTEKAVDGESTTLHRWPLYTLPQIQDTF